MVSNKVKNEYEHEYEVEVKVRISSTLFNSAVRFGHSKSMIQVCA